MIGNKPPEIPTFHLTSGRAIRNTSSSPVSPPTVTGSLHRRLAGREARRENLRHFASAWRKEEELQLSRDSHGGSEESRSHQGRTIILPTPGSIHNLTRKTLDFVLLDHKPFIPYVSPGGQNLMPWLKHTLWSIRFHFVYKYTFKRRVQHVPMIKKMCSEVLAKGGFMRTWTKPHNCAAEKIHKSC